MNQAELNDKLAQYLKLKKNWQLATQIREGTCFAYSICYSSMALSNKLGWWKSAIAKIAAWDGNECALYKPTYLNQAQNPYETLDFLFQRIINYVVFHQPMEEVYRVVFKGMEQEELLQPKKAYFELNKAGNTIKQSKNMIGYFTQDSLDLLLTPSLLQHDIVLIGSKDHSCAIRYTRNQWYFFDSNHSCAKALSFNNKSEFIQRIFAAFNDHVLEIYCASLNTKADFDFTNYYHLLENQMPQLLKNKAFSFFVSDAPDYLPLILAQAKQNKLVRNELFTCLKGSMKAIINHSPQCVSELISVFSQNVSDFDRFIRNLPALVPRYNASQAIRLIELFAKLNGCSYSAQAEVLLSIQKELRFSLEYDSLKKVIEIKINTARTNKFPFVFRHIMDYTNEGMDVEVINEKVEEMDVDRGWFISWF